jgi:hypothetical protein
VRRALHRHVEVRIAPLEIFFFREKLDRTVEVPEAVGSEVELGVQVAGREVVHLPDLDPNIFCLHFQSLERLDAIRLAPLNIQTVCVGEEERDMPRFEVQRRAQLDDSEF